MNYFMLICPMIRAYSFCREGMGVKWKEIERDGKELEVIKVFLLGWNE